MPPSRNLASYNDIKATFDTALVALAKGEPAVRVRFDSHAIAVKWRLRAHRFRNLNTKRIARMHEDLPVSTKYDGLYLQITPGEPFVYITLVETAFKPRLETLEGTPLEVTAVHEIEEEEFIADDLKGDLGL